MARNLYEAMHQPLVSDTSENEPDYRALAVQLAAAIESGLQAFDNDTHRGAKFFNGENSAITRMKNARSAARAAGVIE